LGKTFTSFEVKVILFMAPAMPMLSVLVSAKQQGLLARLGYQLFQPLYGRRSDHRY
jgi:hypothetical protein